ncbi:cupin [Kitasatospora xanthocidica]|uniref:Cupin n=1 Tax=Kitasatospora xanthocidica TaxID=83382 RepID=A0A372ZT57_9ACTN|nr:cupin domain-containing protein [Kitasatospora xanthocidica]RGD58417.1 cupin [Kitasatospora xanthocidica]
MESPTLADWVGDVDGFTGRQWQREPALFPRKAPEAPASPAAPASPFDLDELDAAFDGGLLRTPYLEMVRSDKVTIPPEAFTTSRTVNGTAHHGFADRAKVLAQLRRGATLLLRCVDQWHRPTGELVARLSEELDRRVEAFFFVTPAGAQGLAVHRDDADVFVLQAAGRKTWYVHDAPTTADWRLGELPEDERSPLRLHGVLEPGGVLYIPRGFAHRAVGAGGLSAHLSLTVRDLSVQDLRIALEGQLAEGLGLPARPLGEPAITDACAALLAHARTRLDALGPEDLLRAARAARTGTPHVPAAPAEPAETLTEAARTWESATPADGRSGLASVGRTWRRLRGAAG